MHTGEQSTPRLFFRHLRYGRRLRDSPWTWLAVGEIAGILPQPLLVRAVHDRLNTLVAQICADPPLGAKADRAHRLQQIFHRHVLGGEHWSSLAAELFVSRRQFFRERRFLCDAICDRLQLGPQSPNAGAMVLPSRAHLRYNAAYLALQAGNPDSAEQVLEELCAGEPSGDVLCKARLLAAECAMDRLRFDVAASRCALAEATAESLVDVVDRAIACARVGVARSRYYMLLSDYHRAKVEIASALHALAPVPPSSDTRCSELMKAILGRKAELAIHAGDFARALDQIRRAEYAAGPNETSSESSFNLAMSEAATETFAGHFHSAKTVLEEALARAERLGFNRQIVRLSIDHAWIESAADTRRGLALVPKVTALAEALHLPALSLEAAIFAAVSAYPATAIQYAAKARYASPPRSLSAFRATIAHAAASYELGNLTDASDLAVEAERQADRLDNNRMRACTLALFARVKLKTGNHKAAMSLKNDAEQLLRRYAAAAEQSRFADWVKAT